jgi:hypothetical protein
MAAVGVPAAGRYRGVGPLTRPQEALRVDWTLSCGLRESGLGIGGIPYTIEDVQAEKMLVIRSKELE